MVDWAGLNDRANRGTLTPADLAFLDARKGEPNASTYIDGVNVPIYGEGGAIEIFAAQGKTIEQAQREADIQNMGYDPNFTPSSLDALKASGILPTRAPSGATTATTQPTTAKYTLPDLQALTVYALMAGLIVAVILIAITVTGGENNGIQTKRQRYSYR